MTEYLGFRQDYFTLDEKEKDSEDDCILAAVIYFETDTDLRIDWYYLEQQWEYSDNMEKLIKEPELESLWNDGKKIINR